MKRNRKPAGVLLLGATVSLLWAATFASSASAVVWKFNGVTLAGSETLLSHALESSFTVPGLTTTCKPFVYGMTISNPGGGGGIGSITEVPLSNCFTASKSCTVKTIGAEALPWAAKLTSVAGSSYLVVEGIKLGILYEGEECVLGETLVVIKGSAGGLIENATESVTFSSASFTATGTSLKALGQSIKWTGSFRMIPTGSHIGQSLSVS
jgi:hypothetical protein